MGYLLGQRGSAPVSMAASAADDVVELAITSLPLETRFPPFRLRQYGGFWLVEKFLKGVLAVHSVVETRPSDVLLGSFPKCGTTWLKALAFATRNLVEHSPHDLHHPLRRCNPHDMVRYMEIEFGRLLDDGGADDVFVALPSPRLLATHLPYSLLPRRITAEESSCRIIVMYICRDPKDAFISSWFFTMKEAAATAARAQAGEDTDKQQTEPAPYTFEEAFELFCDGKCVNGPQWRHVVGYWEESRRRPEKVLFLRYDEMLWNPARNVKKLAERSHRGVVQPREPEKHGREQEWQPWSWSNHITPAMAERLDKIVEEALQGSGFSFAVAESSW
ncbi:hypothetical protein VPH35_104227 [Triticum aestivum]